MSPQQLPLHQEKNHLKSLLYTFAKLDNPILNKKLYGVIEKAMGKLMRCSALNKLCNVKYFIKLQGFSALID